MHMTEEAFNCAAASWSAAASGARRRFETCKSFNLLKALSQPPQSKTASVFARASHNPDFLSWA
jgi:hypothetical protein